MASTYTTNLQLEKVTTGEKAGLWGTITNTNLEILEQAASGYVSIDVAAADVTLVLNDGATGTGKNLFYKLTGTLTGNRQLIMPATAERIYIVKDSTVRSSSNYTLTVKTAGGTDYVMPVASTTLLYSDGTNTSLGMLDKGYTTHTAAYTAVAGDQIFCDTKTTNAFTVSLPAGAVGSEVTLIDSQNYFASNNLTIDSNGAEKINSSTSNLVLVTNGQAITLIYANATVGWIYKTNTI
jgi:hypothetical protein|tara:strand:- start:2487 stop:3200 length:714 start_codon:yes stop_codon:yes gene_type:complete